MSYISHIQTKENNSTVNNPIAIPFGTCSTAKATAAKTISITNFPSTIETGMQINVKFTNGNSAASPTLSINNGTAIEILTTINNGINAKNWAANTILSLTYDGTSWAINSIGAFDAATATGNAGSITYISHTQDSTNKKKFIVTGSVSAPAPTVSAGYIENGTDGTGTNRTVSLTITDAQAQAAVGSGSATTPDTTITANPGNITWDSTNSIFKTIVSKTQDITPDVVAGYISEGTAGTITVSGSKDISVGSLSVNITGLYAATPVIQNKTAAVSGKTQIEVSPTTAITGISTYYIAVETPEDLNALLASPTVESAGYVSSNHFESSSDGGANGANASGTYYIPIPTAEFEVSANKVKTKSSKAGWVSANTIVGTIDAGTIDVTDLTITPSALSGTWDSTNEKYIVSQASTTADMQSTVTTAGYVSSSVGTKNKGTATVSAPSDLEIPKATFAVDGPQYGCTTAGYIPAGFIGQIDLGSLSNSAASGKTYDELSGPALNEQDYLYINAGWYPDSKISLATLIPDDPKPDAGNSNILKGYEAFDTAGKRLLGTIENASWSNTYYTTTNTTYGKIDNALYTGNSIHYIKAGALSNLTGGSLNFDELLVGSPTGNVNLTSTDNGIAVSALATVSRAAVTAGVNTAGWLTTSATKTLSQDYISDDYVKYIASLTVPRTTVFDLYAQSATTETLEADITIHTAANRRIVINNDEDGVIIHGSAGKTVWVNGVTVTDASGVIVGGSIARGTTTGSGSYTDFNKDKYVVTGGWITATTVACTITEINSASILHALVNNSSRVGIPYKYTGSTATVSGVTYYTGNIYMYE